MVSLDYISQIVEMVEGMMCMVFEGVWMFFDDVKLDFWWY